MDPGPNPPRGRVSPSQSVKVAPFGITTTIVNPGFFRTELLTEQSTSYAEPSIADYDERRGPLVAYWKSQNGQQSGDPNAARYGRSPSGRSARSSSLASCKAAAAGELGCERTKFQRPLKIACAFGHTRP